MRSSQGAGGLEIHKYMIALSEKRKCNAEFSLIASKKIIKDSKEVWMSSLPVDIKDDSLGTGQYCRNHDSFSRNIDPTIV